MPGARRYARDQFPQFEWDENNEERLWIKHEVSALEAEQCFANPHSDRRVGSDYLVLGETDSGRQLLLVYERKGPGIVRVYSGRDMTDREKLAFRDVIGR